MHVTATYDPTHYAPLPPHEPLIYPLQVGLALSVSVIVLLLMCGGASAGSKWHPRSMSTEG